MVLIYFSKVISGTRDKTGKLMCKRNKMLLKMPEMKIQCRNEVATTNIKPFYYITC